MDGSWDSISQMNANNELITAVIEFIGICAVIGIIVVLVYLKKKYPKLTKKGFNLMIFGFIIFLAHYTCDFLDTIAIKEISGQTTRLYYILDSLDAVFSFIGLFIIGFAFLQIAKYGMILWKEDSK